MCIAVVGKVKKIEGEKAQVDCRGNQLTVVISLVEAKVGDHVLIHAGCAIEVLEEEKAKEIDDLFTELLEVLDDNH